MHCETSILRSTAGEVAVAVRKPVQHTIFYLVSENSNPVFVSCIQVVLFRTSFAICWKIGGGKENLLAKLMAGCTCRHILVLVADQPYRSDSFRAGPYIGSTTSHPAAS